MVHEKQPAQHTAYVPVFLNVVDVFVQYSPFASSKCQFFPNFFGSNPHLQLFRTAAIFRCFGGGWMPEKTITRNITTTRHKDVWFLMAPT